MRQKGEAAADNESSRIPTLTSDGYSPLEVAGIVSERTAALHDYSGQLVGEYNASYTGY